jgi:hypothetical protein
LLIDLFRFFILKFTNYFIIYQFFDENILINLIYFQYNEHRQFIEGIAKMRSIVRSAFILHIGMQHWYLEKSP